MDIRIIPIREVLEIINLSRTCVWRMIKDGKFPVPRRIGGTKIGFISTELEEWINNQPRVNTVEGYHHFGNPEIKKGRWRKKS